MKVTFVKDRTGDVITVGVGPYAFPIKDGKVTEDECQRVGNKVNGRMGRYLEAWKWAQWAWETQLCDSEECHDEY